jgi:hypothetical protein
MSDPEEVNPVVLQAERDKKLVEFAINEVLRELNEEDYIGWVKIDKILYRFNLTNK